MKGLHNEHLILTRVVNLAPGLCHSARSDPSTERPSRYEREGREDASPSPPPPQVVPQQWLQDSESASELRGHQNGASHLPRRAGGQKCHLVSWSHRGSNR